MTGIALALTLAYAISLFPGARGAPGYRPVVDGWLNSIADAAIIAVLVVRGWVERRERAAWWCLATGLTAALAGSVAYYAYYQHQVPVSSPSLADVGWLAFYPLLYSGLLLLLRERSRDLPPSLWLDGLGAGLTATALASAYLDGAAVHPAAGTVVGVAVTTAYPLADLILLAVGVAGLSMLRGSAGSSWWLLCAGFMTFAVTDALYAAQAATGSYVSGGPLDLGWVLARACLAVAAWTSVRDAHRCGSTRVTGLPVLALPTLCALAVLGLLFHGTHAALPPGTAALALIAGVLLSVRIAMTFREVQRSAELQRQALTDELTGLANRRHFYQALSTASQALPRHRFAVLLIDLDRFKEVNDSLGHHAGDQLLRVISARLRPLVRPGDLLARVGGDEYAFLVRDVSQDEALVLAWAVQAEVQAPASLGAATVSLDASIGVALAPQHAGDSSELLQMSDLAMYAAKARGGGVLVYDEARDGSGRHRLELITQLREGLHEHQLVLHYQPQVDLRTGRAGSVEALVRWQHPRRGLLPPVEFIPLAESAGLMGKLTAQVLEEALIQCSRWRTEGSHLQVAVNVSPSVLIDHDFPTQVEYLLSTHHLPPSALVLEVTEDLLMAHRDRAVSALTRLRKKGVQVSIDDYGTGYSSLAYLMDLPVTELKLDRAFVATMTSSARSVAIVKSTTHLAHALGLHLVAEGVEDAETLHSLRAVGCDLVQGYHLARPVPAHDVPRALVSATSALNTHRG
ncbi:putative bifunctional diguanylate cyclase/phosphodiesterase [Kineococcus xinjiangensis]|uniref:putative bifunctional diguanylate cyclase/phosphodiesterase n=1 Tax=Kineococcus xinjiangensis TaxID=512762 RepID=UPI001304933D|nr:EAL domain-containing protein [Kineococcus xinjiangensis]